MAALNKESKKLIVVLGVTGNQGSSVANTFLHTPGWAVRGVTRDDTKPAAKELAVKGVEMVRGDLNDRASLTAAFRGAHAVFAVTDFWAPFFSPDAHAAAAAQGSSINRYCYDVEVQQGVNIAEAAADPEVLGTLQRFVYSSLSDAKKWSRGKYTWVYHFDSKAKVVQYVSEKLPALKGCMSTVQIGEYADNWKRSLALAPKKQADGSFVIAKCDDGEALIPMVVTTQDTGSFVHALVQSKPGTHLLGCGTLMGWKQYAKVWGSLLGVQCSFKQVTLEEYTKGVPGFLVRELQESNLYQTEFGWTGGDPEVVYPKDLSVPCPTTAIETYIKNEDWSPVLNQKHASTTSTI